MNRIRALFVAFIVVTAATPLSAEIYYLSPNGDDSRTGLSPALAWATLQHAEDVMVAGDTLFIMGGTYTAPQQFMRYNGNGGAPGRPLVFKAYGDSRAIFERSGGADRHSRQFWYFAAGADYVTIDGFGHLAPHDSLMIKLEGREDASYLIRFIGTATNRTVACNIKGVEVDGNFPTPAMIAAGTPGGLLRYGVGWVYGDRDTLLSCYIHDIYHPTGDLPPGDGTDRAQGTGEAVFLESCNRTYLARNTFVNSNHAIISVQPDGSTAPGSFGVKFVNNKCSNSWGGGVYFICNNYNLIEGNIIALPTTSTTKTKGPLGVQGEHLTARRNVIYNRDNLGGVSMNAALGIGLWPYNCDSSLVYNNTIFGTRGYDLHLLVNNTGAAGGSTSHAWDTRVANNIMYKGHGRNPDFGSSTNPYYSVLKLWLYDALPQYNWVNPDERGVLPSSTHFGGNKFFHNCMLKDSVGADYYRTIAYAGSSAEGNPSIGWSVNAAQTLDNVAFFGNIEVDPLLASELPGSVGVFSDWWHLRENSPCIDAGAVVNDHNGAYVESYYAARGEPGYGWGNLPYMGAAPDIGAHEFTGENPAPFFGPRQNRVQPLPPPR
ncbi:MAG: right-handed parallel beta-helix repeat-containing protein [Candidatus Latescibacterota bacterium]|nr:MAG: right-handed parallel beta-helix repeat-containing protein [Candidatus Latescibacterota bacterium]